MKSLTGSIGAVLLATIAVASAHALDAWHAGDRRGSRPPGRLRVHQPERVAERHAWWAGAMYRTFVDPDGRPRARRRLHQH